MQWTYFSEKDQKVLLEFNTVVTVIGKTPADKTLYLRRI